MDRIRNALSIHEIGTVVFATAGQVNWIHARSEHVWAFQAPNGKWGIFDQQDRICVEPEWDAISSHTYRFALDDGVGWIVVWKNGKQGLIDRSGKIILMTDAWDELHRANDQFIVCRDKREGVIDQNGNTVIPMEWSKILPIGKNRYLVERNGLYGIMDNEGHTILPPEWKAKEFGKMLWARKEDGLYGILNEQDGSFLLPPSFEEVGMMPASDMVPVCRNGLWGYYDTRHMNLAVPCQWEMVASCFEDGEGASVQKNGKWGWIDAGGQLVIEPMWDRKLYFTNGMAIVSREKKWYLIDQKGNVHLEWSKGSMRWLCQEKNLLQMRDERERLGMMDVTGRIILECRWKDIEPLDEDLLVLVEENDTHWIADTRGNIRKKTDWTHMEMEREGIWVKTRNGICVADMRGNILVGPEWDEVHALQNGGFAVQKNDLWGYVSQTGRLLTEAKWMEYVDGFSDGSLLLKGQDGWHRMDSEGRILW